MLLFGKFKTKQTIKQKQTRDMKRRAAAACMAIFAGLAGLLQYKLQMAIVYNRHRSRAESQERHGYIQGEPLNGGITLLVE